jgi:glutamate synthase domain-containing protein 3
MNQYTWIYQLSAGGALIFFCYLLLRFVIGKLTTSLNALEATLREMEKTMDSRDQIILNHLETFTENEKAIAGSIKSINESQVVVAQVLGKICREFDINNGGKR